VVLWCYWFRCNNVHNFGIIEI